VPLDLQPVLTGELVRVRPLVPDDFAALRRIAADPAVWEQHPSKDRTEAVAFREWFGEAMESGGALVVEDRVSNEVIGTSRLVRRAEDEVEIGWTFLAPSRWGGAWNGELKRLMLDHVFDVVSRVVFTVHSGNIRSQRAVERLGAIRVGTAPDCRGRGENVVFHLSRQDHVDLRRPGTA